MSSSRTSPPIASSGLPNSRLLASVLLIITIRAVSFSTKFLPATNLISYNLTDFTTKKSLFNGYESNFISYSYINKNSWDLNELDLLYSIPFINLFEDEELYDNFRLYFQDSILNSTKKQLNNDSKQVFKHIVYKSAKSSIIQNFTKLVKHEDFDEYSR